MKISRLKKSIKHKLNRFFFGGGSGLGECIALVRLRIILRTLEQVKKELWSRSNKKETKLRKFLNKDLTFIDHQEEKKN